MLPPQAGSKGVAQEIGRLFFGSGESTGSIGVVTINLPPRIAYLANDRDDFFKRLDKMMDLAARSLKVKREIITRLLGEGLYPYTERYLGNFDNHFSTIGLVGMNETGLNANWLKADLTDPAAQRFAKEVLNHMRERLSDYQELYGDLYNLEATPAESTMYRLAKHDREHYPPHIITATDAETPYYTNSSHLPVSYTDDIFSALDIQDELQTLYTSGTVFHAFVGEKLPSWQSAANLVRTIAENYQLPYYTISPTYSICQNHGYLVGGEQFVCPRCGQGTEVYSRITGYYRPVANWNAGKTQEYKERKLYDLRKREPAQNGKAEDTALLFTTEHCPDCRVAIAILDRTGGIPYRVVQAEREPNLVQQYEVRQAPTLVWGGTGLEAEIYHNASQIQKFADSRG